jgi:signal transduction histidine kinase
VLLSKTVRSSSTLKLAFIYVIAFCAAIFGLLGYVYWSTVTYLYEISDRAISVERAVLAKAYEAGGRDGLVTLVDRRLTDPYFNDWVYLLTDQSLDYIAGNLKRWPAALRGHEGWSTVAPVDWQSEAPKRPPLRVTYQILPDGYHLLLGRDIKDLDRFDENVTIGLGSAAVLFLILAAAAGVSTSRRSVARIEAINATTREIMRTGLGKRIPLRGTEDEWDGLAQNLNSMLDRIEELVESNRQVSDNVAHDLRTPLTRMRGRLERAYNRQFDPSHYHALIGDVIAELDDILRTFSSLLRISQIEIRERTAAFRKIDLSVLAREVVELFDAAAEEKGVVLQTPGDEGVFVLGDRDLLFDAVSNLVDNAIKYGGSQSEVRIAVVQSTDGPVLSVADHGPGIPIEERKHVFERFYRLERSRNSPGNGLGLSLVAAVANLHDALIEMTENSPGLRIELHFASSEKSNPQHVGPRGQQREGIFKTTVASNG